MKRTAIALLLACIILCALPVCASADSGSCGESLTWTLEGDTLTISGTGDMWDSSAYAEYTPPWVACTDHYTIHNVILEEGVASLGRSIFASLYSLESIQIPRSLTRIGGYAFGSGENLKNISYTGTAAEFYAITDDGENQVLWNAYACQTGCLRETSGCFNGLTWSLSNDYTVLTLSGGYETPLYLNNNPWEPVADKILSVKFGTSEMPYQYDNIGDYCFKGCTSLKSIVIPAGVKIIRNEAFRDCTALKTVILPSTLTSIEWGAFRGCTALESITIPARVDFINQHAFRETGLTSIVIPDGVTTIYDETFYRCKNLRSVSLPGSLTTVKSLAFFGCDSLNEVEYPGSDEQWNNIDIDQTNTSLLAVCGRSTVTGNCGSNLNWELNGGTLTIIGSGALSNAWSWNNYTSHIKKLILPDGLTDIAENGVFNNFQISEAVLPDGLTIIPRSTFRKCSMLQSVTIPGTVTTIGEYAFQECTSLKSLIIPEGVTTLETGAFYGCTNLETITLPVSLASIGMQAFEGCTNLTTVNYAGTDAQWARVNIDNRVHGNDILHTLKPQKDDPAKCGENVGWSLTDGVLHLTGTGSMFDYQLQLSEQNTNYATTPWYEENSNIHTVIVDDGITSIGNYAFYDLADLTKVTLPKGLTSIGAYAFSCCVTLPELFIPDSVTTIGASAFSRCQQMKTIHLPEGLTKISRYMLGDCYALKNFTIPDGIITLDDLVFAYDQLESVVIPVSVQRLGSECFYYCNDMNVYYTGTEEQWNALLAASAADAVPQSAVIYFNYTPSTTPDGDNDDNGLNWSFQSGVLTIGGSCEMPWYLEDSDIPWGAKKSEIISVIIEPGITNIGRIAFQDCINLTEISIANTVTEIDEFAFVNCSSLKSVSIPAHVRSVGYLAFLGCSSLTEFRVDKDNSVYSDIDGVLFNKAGTELVYYPSGRMGAYTVPDGVTQFENFAFRRSLGLTKVILPNSLSTIAWGTFDECQNLSSIFIPQSITAVENWAFIGCDGLRKVLYSGTQEQWDEIAIGDYNYPLNSARLILQATESDIAEDDVLNWEFNNGVLTISGSGYMPDYLDISTIPWLDHIPYITSVIIQPGLLNVGSNAFSDYPNLAEVSIPSTVTEIGEYAFLHSVALKSVYLPAQVQSVGILAFGACPNLVEITVAPDNTALKDINGVLFNKSGTKLLSYPGGREGAYTIPAGVTSLNNFAFTEATALTEVTLPNTLTEIAYGAFFECSNMTSVYIPNSVTYIQDRAFNSCNSLNKIYYSGTQEQWDAIIIEDNTQWLEAELILVSDDYHDLPSITLPAAVTVVESKAFYGTAAEVIIIPATCTSVASDAFDGCVNLKFIVNRSVVKIVPPAGVTLITE